MAPAFERDPDPAGPLIRGFGAGGFSIEGRLYRAVMLTPDRAIAWDAPPPLAELGLDALAPLLAMEPAPEFLLIGTGSTTVFPPRALVNALEARGIGVEVMDSRAAARTWGVLRTEERWIGAAILPV